MTWSEEKLYKKAYFLSMFTIVFNIVEGLVSMIAGFHDETLTLFGFGVNSVYADAIGTAGLVYFSLSEGKEAFQKSKGLRDKGTTE